ncbi:MAG: F-type H+-transporting ATPase subunit a [Polaribacter sp.]|jgi:F-type H+-transporting ATPase subunit a
MKVFYQIILFVFVSLLATNPAFAEGDTDGKAYDPARPAFHHISDANVYSIGPINLRLPYMLYAPDQGWSVGMSNSFNIVNSHGDGSKAIDGYVLVEGRIKRIAPGQGFPTDQVVDLEVIGGHGHHDHSHGDDHAHDNHAADAEVDEHEVHYFHHDENAEGIPYAYFDYKGKKVKVENSSTADAGVFGGGITSFYDFSITKNVMSMLLVCFFMCWFFIGMARKYKRTEGQAPSGFQSLFETIIVFIQEEVAKPFLGKDWARLLPFLLTLFFFILGLNLWGQIPFFGGANVTGNLAVTMVLAIVAFIVTTINGNKTYWEHTLWMPGVPALLKVLILTPVEILGLFIKPITLALRLFANITAGHMVMVIFVALIFLFGEAGNNLGAGYATAVGSILLTLFMMAIELLVAFIQAFVFTILTASYLGAATEEAHH